MKGKRIGGNDASENSYRSSTYPDVLRNVYLCFSIWFFFVGPHSRKTVLFPTPSIKTKILSITRMVFNAAGLA